MRITNKFAAWYYLSSIILTTLVGSLQLLFDIRGLLLEPPDVVVYVSSPELQKLVPKEWAEYENRYGDMNRLEVRKITEKTVIGEKLKDNSVLVLINEAPDTQMISALEKSGLEIAASKFLSAKQGIPRDVFLMGPEKKSRVARKFSDFLNSAAAQDIAYGHLSKRKGRLS